MLLHLNFKSGIPVYLQIVQQVKAAAATGVLKAGDPLPSVRALAEELRINRNTAAKAYAELEAENVVETQAGRGCFVRANGASPLRRAVRSERVAAEMDALIVQAHHLNLAEEDVRALFDRRLAAFRARQGGGDARGGTENPSESL